MDQTATEERNRAMDAYVEAFLAAKRDLRPLQEKAFLLKSQLAEIEAEIEQKMMIAKSLADVVAKQGNQALKEQLLSLQREPGHSARTSVAFDAVRKLLSEMCGPRAEVTPTDVLQKLKTQNIGVDPKAVYNALNYLEKTGKLERVSRGHYLVKDGGYAVHSSHEVGRLEDRDSSD